MNEKVLAVVRPTAFTSHYSVKCSDGTLQIRTVHTCPRCKVRCLIIWNDDDSVLFANSIFGFRRFKGCHTAYIQSYCHSCRSFCTSSKEERGKNG